MNPIYRNQVSSNAPVPTPSESDNTNPNAIPATPNKNDINGPANAIQKSWSARVRFSDIMLTPPNTSNVMPMTRYPRRLAVNECASSCNSTEPNNDAVMKPAISQRWIAVNPSGNRILPDERIQVINTKPIIHDQWTSTGISNSVPMRSEDFNSISTRFLIAVIVVILLNHIYDSD